MAEISKNTVIFMCITAINSDIHDHCRYRRSASSASSFIIIINIIVCVSRLPDAVELRVAALLAIYMLVQNKKRRKCKLGWEVWNVLHLCCHGNAFLYTFSHDNRFRTWFTDQEELALLSETRARGKSKTYYMMQG